MRERLRAWLRWRRARPTPERSGDRFAGDYALWLLDRPGRRRVR